MYVGDLCHFLFDENTTIQYKVYAYKNSLYVLLIASLVPHNTHFILIIPHCYC